MKILKLAAIFLILAGGIFLALNWNSIFKSSKRGEFGEEDLINISEKCEEIRSAWALQSGWDEGLYTAQRRDIDQSKNMGMFSLQGYETVNNTLRETVANKTCEGYKSGLHKSPFSDAFLQKQYKGVQTLMSAENMKEDIRIKEIIKLHSLYTNINKFAKSSHAITPKFKQDEADWISFASAQSGILAQAKKYRDDPLFKEMSSVPGFQDALNESKLRSTTERYRTSFYEGLSRQIISYFDTVEHDQTHVQLLNNIYQRFVGQANGVGVEAIAMYLVQMRSEANS